MRARRRSAELASLLGLTPSGRLADGGALAALVLVGASLGLAAAQPVVSSVQPREGRTDAEVLVIVDITRSMSARKGREGTSRFARAVAAAKELRSALPEIPVGLASLTDRVLPHLFPTIGENAFTATAERSLGIERPPPDRSGRGRATAIDALGAISTQNFYGAKARRKLAIVITDGESTPVDLGTLRVRLLGRVTVLFVHVWDPDERVLGPGGVPERANRPDPLSVAFLAEAARAVGGGSFVEGETERVVSAARRALGEGPIGRQGKELQSVELAPHAALVALAPLLFLVWRRNLAST